MKSVAQPPKSVPEPSNILGLGLLGLGLTATKVKSVLSKKTKSPTDNPQEPDS
ncbi:PEP-CTERM sorting domain-containing protein [Microcystis flos-aquae]|uniref:PEP-CTERM sorting domain-containing protein n=1 Tax=Microcystis flos-aquae TaxID=109615 RepID=UPI003BF8DECC